MKKTFTFTYCLNKKLKENLLLFKLKMLVLKKVIICFFCVALIFYRSSAQEMQGYINSNYAGITGAPLNPTSILNSRYFFDLNLIGLHLNLDNNYIYLAKDEYKFTRFLSPNAEFPEHQVRVSQTRFENRVYYDHFNESLKRAYGQVKVIGPGVMYNRNDFAVGLSTSVRNIFSADDIPFEIAKFGAEGFDYYPLHRIRFTNNNNFRAGSLSFAEIAGTFAHTIIKENLNHFSAGITVKGLLGFGGGIWTVDNIDYMLPNGDTIIVYNANGTGAVSLPINYVNNDILFPNPFISGMGIAADLGVTYQLRKRGHTNRKYAACEQPFEDYYYKVGVSLIDIGYIKFTKNTQQITLENASGTWYDFTRRDIGNLDLLFRSVSGTFGPDSTSLISYDPFKIFLPSAASVQFDYNYNDNIFVNASFVYPILLNGFTLARPVTLSLTPRYESDYFELAVPFTLHNYIHPRLGLSLRFSSITVGTDKLGGFFGLNHFTGMDFYFTIKLSKIKGKCRSKMKGDACNGLEYRLYRRDMNRIKIRNPW